MEPEPPVPALGFRPEGLAVDSLVVRSGETFTGLMTRLGMSQEDAFELGQLCDSTFDVRKLRAGNAVLAYYDSTGSARRLRYAVYQHGIVRSTVFQCAYSLALWNVDKPVVHER